MTKAKRFPKLTAMLLVLACVLGLLSASASAAGTDTIKLEKFAMSGVSYTSESLGTCTIHQMYCDYGGATTIGFCGTNIARKPIGDTEINFQITRNMVK